MMVWCTTLIDSYLYKYAFTNKLEKQTKTTPENPIGGYPKLHRCLKATSACVAKCEPVSMQDDDGREL